MGNGRRMMRKHLDLLILSCLYFLLLLLLLFPLLLCIQRFSNRRLELRELTKKGSIIELEMD